MKGDRLQQFKVADPEPTRRARVPQKRARVKGLSAACKKKRHYSCFSLTCTCIHHFNDNRKNFMTKEEILDIAKTGDCFHIWLKDHEDFFNLYITCISPTGLIQDASDLPYRYIGFNTIERIEAY